MKSLIYAAVVIGIFVRLSSANNGKLNKLADLGQGQRQGQSIHLFADPDTNPESLQRSKRETRSRQIGTGSDEDDYDDEIAKLETEREKRQSGSEGPIVASADDITLPAGYSKFKIPKDAAENPIKLEVYVQVVNILDLDELNEIIYLDIVFAVSWTDYKILYANANAKSQSDTVKVNLTALPTITDLTREEIKAEKQTLNNPFILDKIWKPNLFIENLLSVKQPAVMSKPVTVKFLPRVGHVEYITRISLKMDCEMDFHYYPADTQNCDFSIRGFSYTRKDLNLFWDGNGAFLEDLSLPSFDVKIDWTAKKNWSVSKNNNDPDDDDDLFDLLIFRISARRKLSYHFVQTYLASTFYIVITTLCFLLPSRMIEARIGISMTTLLTLTAMFASVRESTPVVSYVKAIDIWMVGCIFFVFLTLSQFTFHTWAKNLGEEGEDSKVGAADDSTKNYLDKSAIEMDNLCGQSGNGTEAERLGDGEVNFTPGTASSKKAKKSKLEFWADLSERFGFPFFLTIFGVYTAIYWVWLLDSADYFNWDVDSTWNHQN